jgi:hypothetical protein
VKQKQTLEKKIDFRQRTLLFLMVSLVLLFLALADLADSTKWPSSSASLDLGMRRYQPLWTGIGRKTEVDSFVECPMDLCLMREQRSADSTWTVISPDAREQFQQQNDYLATLCSKCLLFRQGPKLFLGVTEVPYVQEEHEPVPACEQCQPPAAPTPPTPPVIIATPCEVCEPCPSNANTEEHDNVPLDSTPDDGTDKDNVSDQCYLIGSRTADPLCMVDLFIGFALAFALYVCIKVV